jgi:AraC-like DNA-binding protein
MLLHIIELIPIFSLSGDEKRLIAQEALGMNHGQLNADRGLLANLPGDTIRFILMLCYFGYSWVLIFKEKLLLRKDKIQNYFDSWIKTFLILMGVFQVVFLFQYFLNIQYFITGYFFPTLRIINDLVLLFLICAYTIMLMDKLHISMGFFHLPNGKSDKHLQILLEEKKSSVSKDQYENASQNLSKEIDPEFELLKIRMISLLEDQKIFLKPNLLVGEFAKEMGVSVRHLPFLFFSVYGRSFNDVLNKYRIESAKQKIEEGLLESYTIESIGQDCGFNSRTTFYNVFIKEFSMSPKEYWSRFCDQRKEHD